MLIRQLFGCLLEEALHGDFRAPFRAPIGGFSMSISWDDVRRRRAGPRHDLDDSCRTAGFGAAAGMQNPTIPVTASTDKTLLRDGHQIRGDNQIVLNAARVDTHTGHHGWQPVIAAARASASGRVSTMPVRPLLTGISNLTRHALWLQYVSQVIRPIRSTRRPGRWLSRHCLRRIDEQARQRAAGFASIRSAASAVASAVGWISNAALISVRSRTSRCGWLSAQRANNVADRPEQPQLLLHGSHHQMP